MNASQAPQRTIPFSPPDITEEEISEVAEALRSGWITTGPRTKELERQLKDFTGAAGFACFSSATSALECALRVLGIGPGDEVISCAYTYTASASPVIHVGATLVLCDVTPGSFLIDLEDVARHITPRTKAIIPVDLGGCMVDYDALLSLVESRACEFEASNDIQAALGRIAIVADGAHALGSRYKGRPAGSVADFTSFSFHAVKNFTTAEGGGLAWRDFGYSSQDIYHQLMLLSLHGQSKDALAKTKVGAWEYDVIFPGYKCNMTDIQAALGLVQLRRYPDMLARRRAMIAHYEKALAETPVKLISHHTDSYTSSGHLMLVRIDGVNCQQRNCVIERMGEAGIACNVHYKPLPLLSAYKNLGFAMSDYPHSYAQFENEISLPLHTKLTDEDIDYICENLIRILKEIR